MIVDDNETFREVMRSYVENLGFTVEIVDSGLKAIEMLEQTISKDEKPCDLIFMDWQMPGINGIESSRLIRKIYKGETKPKIILVSGFGREDVMKESEDLQLDGFLFKPITPSMVFDTILEAFSLKSFIKKGRVRGDSFIPNGFNAIRGSRILLVEDNELNQQVVIEFLEEEGFFVSTAENGKIAIDKIRESANNNIFDAVLMDLQMPIMDGYSATQEIRKYEGFNDLPIIAMTADAMGGVRERVTNVGMNDYIAKPIAPAVLYSILLKWIKPGNRAMPDRFEQKLQTEKKEPENLPVLPGINVERGIIHLGGSIKKYKKLLSKFIDNQKDTAQKIRKAIDLGNDEEAIRLAHTLKGISATIGADTLHEKSQQLESCLIESRRETAIEILVDLGQLLKDTIETLHIVESTELNSAESTVIDFAKLEEYMNQLKVYLHEDDSKAEDVIDDILSIAKGTIFEDHLKVIRADITEIEYEDALKKLENINFLEK